MSFSIPGYWEETTPGDRLRADIDARLREPMQPMANPDVLGKLLPSEPVETVTNSEGGKPLWYQAMNRAEELLCEFAALLDTVDATDGQNPFSGFAADPLSKRVKALLAEMREEGARIRKECRGGG